MDVYGSFMPACAMNVARRHWMALISRSMRFGLWLASVGK